MKSILLGTRNICTLPITFNKYIWYLRNADELAIPWVVVERRNKKMFRSKIIIRRVSLWKTRKRPYDSRFFLYFSGFSGIIDEKSPAAEAIDRELRLTANTRSPSQAKSNFMLLRFSSLIPFFINVTISFDWILRPFVIQV